MQVTPLEDGYYQVDGKGIHGKMHAGVDFSNQQVYEDGRVQMKEFPVVYVRFHGDENLTVNGIRLSGFQVNALDPALSGSYRDGHIRRTDLSDPRNVTDSQRVLVREAASEVTRLHGTPANVQDARVSVARGNLVTAERQLAAATEKVQEAQLDLLRVQLQGTPPGKLTPAPKIVNNRVSAQSRAR